MDDDYHWSKTVLCQYTKLDVIIITIILISKSKLIESKEKKMCSSSAQGQTVEKALESLNNVRAYYHCLTSI